jgi:Tfp pilus assembly protein PilV
MNVRINNSMKRALAAFTLLEVMIAVAIFFACVFGILALVSQSLKGARSLRPVNIDARSAIALLSLTNRLEEGPIPSEVIEAFEKENPGLRLDGMISEYETNGLFLVDFMVVGAPNPANATPVSVTTKVLLYRPLSTRRTGLTPPMRR